MNFEIWYIRVYDDIEDEIEPFCSDSCADDYAERNGFDDYEVSLADPEYSEDLEGEKCEMCGEICGVL